MQRTSHARLFSDKLAGTKTNVLAVDANLTPLPEGLLVGNAAGPGVATETLTLFAYQEGFKKFNLGYTSALSFLFLAVVLILSLVYLALLKPWLEKYK